MWAVQIVKKAGLGGDGEIVFNPIWKILGNSKTKVLILAKACF